MFIVRFQGELHDEPMLELRQLGGLGVLRGVVWASRRKRGPVAFRPRLSTGLALSTWAKPTPIVLITPLEFGR